MKKTLKKRKLFFANLIVILGLFILPYILFGGKYYISGDDTRLYYIYPWEYLVEFTFSSWHHFSSVGTNGPTQFMMPFLTIWSALDLLIDSKITLAYLGFSAPILLGFLFFQLFLRSIIPDNNRSYIAFLGSLFYVLSPIMVYNQYFIFLSTIWLLPLIPALVFFFLRYLENGKFTNIAHGVMLSVVFSIGLFSIPWIAGIFVPLILGLIVVNLTYQKFISRKIVKRSLIFFSALFLSQAFWLFPFVMTYFGGSDVNFGSKVFSQAVSDTFSPTVLATASGNIVYPLLNLFHRQIAFDSYWQLRNVFTDFYDKTLLINIIFPTTLFIGIFKFKKVLVGNNKSVFMVFFIAFIAALFLFTVNIGPFKELFLWLGKIPGFVMFRNFYDKFALSYTIYYAILITFSFSILHKISRKVFLILSTLFLIVLLINLTQIGKIVNAPLWQTENIKRNIMISDEYTDFMKEIKSTVSSTNNIFTVPFGTALYSVIKDTDSDSVYTGTSPVKLFSGINDYSGFLSFYFSEANSIIEKLIVNREYTQLSHILQTYNVNYAFVNENIPTQVLNAWVFDKRMNKSLDNTFKRNFLEDKPIITSESGNYKLYNFKKLNTLIKSKNLFYQKINETKFNIYISKLGKDEELFFADSYHHGWKLYLERNPHKEWCQPRTKIDTSTECEVNNVFIEGNELQYSFRQMIFDESHEPHTDYFVNKWTVNPGWIKNNFDTSYYKDNGDGTIDVKITMYFLPQNYFYFGTIETVIFIIFCICSLVKDKIKVTKTYK